MSALYAIFGFTAWAGVVLGIAIACYAAAALILDHAEQIHQPDNITDSDSYPASLLNAPTVLHSSPIIDGRE